ncbi:MAG TPA: SET domain-containing protein-lysine N-methyltransferase [Stellaceae bacterium]|nr:SET domain-containing protein-lysine N-methyltransferase [Stellaceae bacterium]
MTDQTLLSLKVALGRCQFGNGVFSTMPVQAGEPLFRLDGVWVRDPTTYTIQRDAERHVAPVGALWGMVNHNCHPNVAIDCVSWRMVAHSRIEPGQELTFNYLTTEWDMASPFTCNCGAPHCPGLIRGFRHLDRGQRLAIRALLSPYLAGRFHEGLEDGELVAAPVRIRRKRSAANR